MTAARTAKPKILIVDDETSARAGLVDLLRDEGNSVRGAADGFKALGATEDWTPDLVVTDVHMPGMNGIELMEKIRVRFPRAGVIVMTAFSTVEKAVEAMHLGADDYLTKPIRLDELLVVVQRILQHRQALAELERLREEKADPDLPSSDAWIGQSVIGRDVRRLVEQVADAAAPVLLVGEHGTGKEFAARTMHEISRRSAARFVSVQCSGKSEAELVAELFGEATYGGGSSNVRPGALSLADGGTVLLDDIDAMPSSVQVRLLAFLQDPRVEAAGSNEPAPLDVRVIAATEHDLAALAAAGDFRGDLLYRINVINIRMPTLRERSDDIPMFAAHFLRKHAGRNGHGVRGISERALAALQSFDWPGNLRQLDNAIARGVLVCREFELAPRHLPQDVLGKQRDAHEMPIIPGASMAELERYAILKTLESVGGSTSRAAKVLGISTRTIQYRMSEYRDRDPSGLPAVSPS